MELGLAAIVAELFSRVFFRNSISGGLLVTPCPGISDLVETGDEIELDTVLGHVRNLKSGAEIICPPLPAFLRGMVECGGEKAYIKARMAGRL